MTIYNLSPSALTFSWDGCKRCFYLKVKHNIGYSGLFPGMFGKMGDLTSNYYLDKPSSEISLELPAGIVKFREKWVKSVPIRFPGTTSQCVIKGRFDAIIAFDDGSYGIIDYKTYNASEEKAAFYKRQLWPTHMLWKTRLPVHSLYHPSPVLVFLSLPQTALKRFQMEH